MTMTTQRFSQHIDAPRQAVWDLMLGDAGYREWTTAFCEGSYYQGRWEQGTEIHFLSPGGQGLMATVTASVAPAHVQLRHQAEIENFQVKPETAATWKDGREEYWLHEVDGGTRVDVELEVGADCEAMMSEMWPKALLKLKALCERAT